MKNNSKTIHDLRSIVGDKYVITNKWAKQPFSEGWRYGGGEVLAVVKPGRIMFEVDGVSAEVAKEALRLAAQKLPVHTKVVTRRDYVEA